MRRRDFGKFVVAGLGAAAVTTTSLQPAKAAGRPAKGEAHKIRSAKGKDGKFYLLPTGTVSVKPGSQIPFDYKGLTVDGKPTFELNDIGTGSGSEAFNIVINGTPSTAFDASPTDAVIVDAAGNIPITVEQPPG